MYPASSVADLSAIDASVKAMEFQVQSIKDRLSEETLAIPKAKQKKLQEMATHVPSHLMVKTTSSQPESNDHLQSNYSKDDQLSFGSSKIEHEPEKKGRGPPPLWYISGDELESLSSYMRGRLTIEKSMLPLMIWQLMLNQLLNLSQLLKRSMWDRALELRDIATTEGVKGKHFFLESDIKGPSLKLDNTGKAILTVSPFLGLCVILLPADFYALMISLRINLYFDLCKLQVS
ncbi:Spindle and kinetochore-associated protein 1-like protein [Bienertia sinuspersici]